VRLRQLQLAVEHCPATVIITDPQGDIQYVNPVFQARTGYTAEEALGMNTRAFQSGLQGSAFYQELWTTILAGRIWRGRFQNRKKDGELFWERATIVPVAGADGRMTSCVAVKEDLTELARTEAALKVAQREAATARQTKNAFLANLNHELRTPLNAVLGFVELLQASGLGPRQQEYLDKAGAAARHLHGLIGDLLDYSRLEAGQLDLVPLPFDPRDPLEQLAGFLSARCAEKGLRLRLDLDPAVPPRVLGDSQRLGQVLLYFGDNAVKFTDAGEVTVVARVLERLSGRVRMGFEVADTGIGMTDATVEGLFRAFTQADDSSTRRFGGTGLGLAIAQRMTLLMGGAIEVASQPGKGSRFVLVLELPLVEPAGAEAGERPLQGVAVLLAEDDGLNRMVAREVLTRAGAAVTLAGDGQAALALLRQRRFDAVVLDLHMPNLGGMETARVIRANPLWAALPILALTADAPADVREAVSAVGMDACLNKPLEPQQLVGTLVRLVQRLRRPGPEAPSGAGGLVPGLDSAAAMARLGLEPRTYLTFLQRFGREQVRRMASLRAILARGERAEARLLAHAMKGAAANLGADLLSGLAAALEARLRSGCETGWEAPLASLEQGSRDLLAGLARLDPAPGPEAPAVPVDATALGQAVAALQTSLREDDARAGQDLARLEALVRGGPLEAALGPLRGPIEGYDYPLALERLPAFLAATVRSGAAGTSAGIPPR
jgi:PAS domain S-box-containing protein